MVSKFIRKNAYKAVLVIPIVFAFIFFACQNKSEQSGILTTKDNQYFAHSKVEDSFGVISPWYQAQNGQIDQRVKVSINVLKRYPWTSKTNPPVPHYIPSGRASVTPQGEIQVMEETNATNGDLISRAQSTLHSWTQYYAYSGDPAAFVHGNVIVDYLIQNCLAAPTDPWPEFLISVPFKGEAYGRCNGQTQIDFASHFAYSAIRFYQMNPRADLLDLLKKWGDLLAQNINPDESQPPWPRFTDPEKVPYWSDKPDSNLMTGSVTFVLLFLNDLIRVTNPPQNSPLRAALLRGEKHLKEVLLPKWYALDTWGRHYWDGRGEQLQIVVPDFTAIYILENRDRFPNWKNDVKRILDLNILRTSGYPEAWADLYSGAWLYPESTVCCRGSIGYSPMFTTWASNLYGLLANDPVILERARRKSIIASYDFTNTGYTEDLVYGGQDVYKFWVKAAYAAHIPFHLKAIGYRPDLFAPQGENRLVSSSSVVQRISYKPTRIEYEVFDAPSDSRDILRVSFLPTRVEADGTPLTKRDDLTQNGYTLKDLNNGDYIVEIRRDALKAVVIEGGTSNQIEVINQELTQSRTVTFTGNQVHITGTHGPDGGQAKVFIDGQEQLTGLDLWSPDVRSGTVFTISGLKNAQHTIEIVPLTTSKNPRSTGHKVRIGDVWWSSNELSPSLYRYPAPVTQRVVLGYVGRENLKDHNNIEWKTGLEIAYDFGGPQPTFEIDRFLPTFWTNALPCNPGDCVYAYGIHAHNFKYGFTVFPGQYSLKLHFHCGRMNSNNSQFTVGINDNREEVDVAKLCGTNLNSVVVLERPNLMPKNGTVQVQFIGKTNQEAYVSAMELIPN